MKNKISAILILSFSAVSALAQEEVETVADSQPMEFDYMNILGYVFLAFLIWALFRFLNIMARQRDVKLYHKYGAEVYAKQKKASWWERMKRMATNAVPLEKEHNVALDHNYDGIRELDNDLPPWWLWMFYITIAIGVIYFGYYHIFGYGMNQVEQYEKEVAMAKIEIDEYLAQQSDLIDETNVTLLTSEEDLAKGKEIFLSLCAVCHLPSGAGLVGPNLTDQYWVHGGSIQDVFKTVKYGVPEKGMISWQTQMGAGDMSKVTSYILSLVGTNPENPKAPEGELYIPEDENTKEVIDSSTVAGEEEESIN